MGPSPAVAAVRHAVRTSLADLAPGDLVLVACSGGADSLALAAALAVEAQRAGLRAGAVTVDHGLQDGSAQRAADLADRLRALPLDPVEVRTVTVDGTGGPEAAARHARYAALTDMADDHTAAAILLGHTRDDQAETVLLGLARGSGARSLAGMASRSGWLFRRPLLGLSRDTVRAAAAGLPVWEDPHNSDSAFARSRVRQIALPTLEKELGPGVAAALARTAALLRADADALDGWAATTYDEIVTRGGDGDGVELDAGALTGLPAAIRTRVLRRAALAAGSPPADLSAGHVAELDRLVTDWHGQGPLPLPGGVAASRRYGRLALVAASSRPPPAEQPTPAEQP